MAVSYGLPGSCVAGFCEYTETRTDCAVQGLTCEAGSCVDRCAGVQCSTPPGGVCDNDVAVDYAAPGSCVGGGCEYTEIRTDCAAQGVICVGGACTGPCAGVECNTPPAGVCEGDAAVGYVTPGTCVGGACEYTETRTDCAAQGEMCMVMMGVPMCM